MTKQKRNPLNGFRAGVLALMFLSDPAFATNDILKDFDSLSGNDALLDRAKTLNPQVSSQVVQKRVVERPGRFEISPEYSNVFGGDSYVKTQMIGLSAQYHINYRWSIGVKYGYAFNELTPEGRNLVEKKTVIVDEDGNVIGYAANIPAVDYIKQETLLTLKWYPIYGKMNLSDLGVVHFDVYGHAGGGQMQLESGSSTAMTAGAGMAFWFSQHLTTRFEVSWLNYTAKRFAEKEEGMDLTVGTLSVGYLL